MFARLPFPALAATALLAACGTPSEGETDFTESDEAIRAGLTNNSYAACAVLKLASNAPFAELDLQAGLTSTAARSIIEYRKGDDGLAGTPDDDWFGTLSELDAVPNIGEAAFRSMKAYTSRKPNWACGKVNVQLLSFNDFHGNLKPPAGSSGRIQTGPDANVDRVDAGGVEFMATHVKRLAAENPNTVIVAAGDVIGATPLLSALFHDEPTIESMNLLGLSVTSVGNHEFDEGAEELLRMQYGGCHPVDGCIDGDGFEGAKFEYLGANVIDQDTTQTLLPPYTIRRFGHATIGFVGMTLEGTALVTTAEGTRGLTFKDEVETMKKLLPKMKADGIKTIVLLLHEGGAATGLYNGCDGISGPLFEIARLMPPEVNVIVGGHTNAAHVCDVNGKLVTSAAAFGRLVTDIDLTIDERTGKIVTKAARNVIVTRDVAKDAAQTALITRYDNLAAPYSNRVVGTIDGDLTKTPNAAGESALGDVIADAQLAATRTARAQVAFMNPGGIRTDLIASQLSGGERAGEVTYGELFAVQPFSNLLQTLTLTGAQLDSVLEQQWSLVAGAEKANLLAVSNGFTFTYDSTRAIGDRIDPASIKLDGQVIAPTANVRITVNGFLADGGDGFAAFKGANERTAGPVDVDALETYLRAHPALKAPAATRVTKR